MGINIGDLSSIVLCSIPPNSANFQQRVGRAGRKQGNALISAIATGKAHDLFFYADPGELIDGRVEPAGCYLNAAAILKRQLTAFCLDCWVAQGVSKEELPIQLQKSLDAVDKCDEGRFPYTWLKFIERHKKKLLDDFLSLFTNLREGREKTRDNTQYAALS